VDTLQKAVESLQSSYPHADIPDCMAGSGSRTQVQVDALRDIIRQHAHLSVNKQSGPGFPYALWAPSNKQLLDAELDFIVELVVARLLKLGSKDFRSYTPSQLFKEGLCDPVKLFIKKEPHKLRKILEDALRLISNVSLVDQLEDRVLYSMQNELEIANYGTIPSKPGMGLHDEGIKVIHQNVIDAGNRKLLSIDAKAFDWSQRGYCFEYDALLRCRLYDLSPDDWLVTVILNRHHCVANSLFVDSDGFVYEQLYPGIMLSGWYCTSSSNSHISILMCWLAKSSWAMAQGDDTLSEWIPTIEQVYKDNGMRLGQCEDVTSADFEFCSTRIQNGVGVPLNVGKMVVNALCVGEDAERKLLAVGTLEYELRNHPLRDLVCRSVSKALTL
jgi:hypothetical protein